MATEDRKISVSQGRELKIHPGSSNPVQDLKGIALVSGALERSGGNRRSQDFSLSRSGGQNPPGNSDPRRGVQIRVREVRFTADSSVARPGAQIHGRELQIRITGGAIAYTLSLWYRNRTLHQGATVRALAIPTSYIEVDGSSS